ncbi:MAG: helix-turn-helix transcriptional regulator [Vicinamibacterales bacterium]
MDSGDDVRVRLGKNVRALRVRRGLTQEALGEEAGLSYKFIGEVERGLGNPSIASVASIARALDADIADLFGGSSRPAGAYDTSRRHLAVVRDAQERLASALKDLQNATLGRVTRKKKRRKTKD